VSLPPTRMPDYNPSGRRRFKPLRDRADTTPRVGRIVGIDAKDLMDALGVVLCSGCAILFSPTSDGGAVSITVYYGDERGRDYATSAEEFAEALSLARDLAEAHSLHSTLTSQKVPQRPSQTTSK
jgi:hypothetical protein